MKAVFDANVVIAGAGWRNEPHLCLVLMARRRLLAFGTEETLGELMDTAQELDARKVFRAQSPWPVLEWYLRTVRRVLPAPLGKQRSRDPKDDPYLACALAAGAEAIITLDGDLLALGKPFGVQMLTPRAALSRLALTV